MHLLELLRNVLPSVNSHSFMLAVVPVHRPKSFTLLDCLQLYCGFSRCNLFFIFLGGVEPQPEICFQFWNVLSPISTLYPALLSLYWNFISICQWGLFILSPTNFSFLCISVHGFSVCVFLIDLLIQKLFFNSVITRSNLLVGWLRLQFLSIFLFSNFWFMSEETCFYGLCGCCLCGLSDTVHVCSTCALKCSIYCTDLGSCHLFLLAVDLQTQGYF